MDQRILTLAKNLVQYSVALKPGEKVLIEVTGESPRPLVRAIIKEVYLAKGDPFVNLRDSSIQRELLMDLNEEAVDFLAACDLQQMEGMDAYIGIRAADNVSELSDVPSDKMMMYMERYNKPVHGQRVNETKWVVLRYPNPAMAQLADLSLEAFEDFYFKVCNLDYQKMSKAMDNLVTLMNKTDQVHITGVGTDLTFSIKDIPAIKCAGNYNIPDGEVFTAPVIDSVNGVIQYNTPAVYQGVTYENTRLEFKDGKIINATSNDTKRINEVFDTDKGARYVGEFAIGVNPYIIKAMKDTLFDEKIMGSFHFTPGEAYEEADNGNTSAIHWDLVCIQTEEYGGGSIFFDDILIRKDGLFVLEELKCLNPDQLISID